MSRSVRFAAAACGVAAALIAGVLSAPGTAGAAPTVGTARACAAHVPAHHAACFALVRTVAGKVVSTKIPAGGYHPSQIRDAYNLPAGAHRTVAIVDAYDNPNAESDLAAYRAQYHLPACTTANGCFRKTNQTGGTSYPAGNTGWGLEISLDLDAVSAACRNCHILLVEANSNSFNDLAAAVNYAATQGVAAISNSYGGGDQSPLSAYDHPGIAITASTGDGAYEGPQSPASFASVIGVGGTSLKKAPTKPRGWTEKVWLTNSTEGTGSGCSTLNPKPAWQTAATQCSGDAMADVSADADPATGLAVYDTYGYGGWVQVGGTSLSSPIIASVYAMGGHLGGYPANYTWHHTSDLNDVTVGSNGSCSPSVWCHAGPGWDGPTGLGTPNGTGSF